MKKEREPDLQFPDEQALEERVKKMMEGSDSEVRPTAQSKVEKPFSKKPFIINVSHDNPEDSEETEEPEFSEEPEEPEESKELAEPEVAEEIEWPEPEEVSEPEALSAPILQDESPVEISKNKKQTPAPSKKSIVINHFSDEPDDAGKTGETAEVGDPDDTDDTEPKAPTKRPLKITEPVIMPESVDNPLIPTDMLTSAITRDTEKVIKVDVTPKKNSPKKLEIVESVEPNIDDEIAEAFGVNSEEPVITDAMDDLASETPSIGEDDTKGAPDFSEEKPVEEVKPKPTKPDRFTPLTNIRPQKPGFDAKPTPGLTLDDPKTSRAVDEIVIADADMLLEIPEKHVTKDQAIPEPVSQKQPHPQKVKKRFSKKLLLIILAVILIAVMLAVFALPATRSKAFNTLGKRTSASVTVVDRSTNLPLKNVLVSIGESQQQTDSLGRVSLAGLHYGKNQIVVVRKAFTPLTVDAELGSGDNKIPTVSLVPTGKQYKIQVTNYISEKPTKAEVNSGPAIALTDDAGLATLTVETQEKPFKTVIAAAGFRSEEVTIDPTSTTVTKVNLVPDRKHVYVSSKSGTQDIYKADLDGKNEQLVLKGTGKENNDSVLVANSTAEVVALVSNRESQTSLNVVDLKTNVATAVTKAANLQLIEWSGEYLTYVQTVTDAKSIDANRQKLMSYNYKTNKSQQLAAANYFNSVMSATGKIYFAPSSAYQPANNVGFFKINPDGSGKQSLLTRETWNVYRTSYEQLSLSVQQDWYSYRLGDSQTTKQSAAPEKLENRLYIDAPDGQHSLWVSSASVLNIYNKSTAKETQLFTERGLDYPVRWLNNTILVYRNNAGQPAADYAYSTDGGVPKKVNNVSDIKGITALQIR